MAKFLILDTVRVAGVNPTTQEQLTGTFPKGSDIEGQLINEQGFTLIADGIYWQFPTQNLFPLDVPEVTMPTNGPVYYNPPTNNPAQTVKDTEIVVNTPEVNDASAIWKHPDMPAYVGAIVGGLIGMKVSGKMELLPSILNVVLFTGLGAYGGYKGVKYIMNKQQIKKV